MNDGGLFRGTEPQVLSTDPDNPEEGRTFVWAWTEWFERYEGEDGDVAFVPIASSERDLDQWLMQQGLDRPTLIDDSYARDVKEEFLGQAPLFPEAPEYSCEEPFGEQEPDEDIEHG